MWKVTRKANAKKAGHLGYI